MADSNFFAGIRGYKQGPVGQFNQNGPLPPRTFHGEGLFGSLSNINQTKRNLLQNINKTSEDHSFSQEPNYLEIPHSVPKIIPKITLPTSKGDLEMTITRSVRDGDVAWAMKDPVSNHQAMTGCGTSKNRKYPTGAIVSTAVVNYVLNGLQRHWDCDGVGGHWEVLAGQYGLGKEKKNKTTPRCTPMDIMRIFTPLGVVHGSEKQGGQHFDGGTVTWPVDYVQTIVVDGHIYNLINYWALDDITAGDDLIFSLQKINKQDISCYCLGDNKTESFDNQKGPEEIYQFVPRVRKAKNVEKYGYFHIASSRVSLKTGAGATEKPENKKLQLLNRSEYGTSGPILDVTLTPVMVEQEITSMERETGNDLRKFNIAVQRVTRSFLCLSRMSVKRIKKEKGETYEKLMEKYKINTYQTLLEKCNGVLQHILKAKEIRVHKNENLTKQLTNMKKEIASMIKLMPAEWNVIDRIAEVKTSYFKIMEVVYRTIEARRAALVNAPRAPKGAPGGGGTYEEFYTLYKMMEGTFNLIDRFKDTNLPTGLKCEYLILSSYAKLCQKIAEFFENHDSDNNAYKRYKTDHLKKNGLQEKFWITIYDLEKEYEYGAPFLLGVSYNEQQEEGVAMHEYVRNFENKNFRNKFTEFGAGLKFLGKDVLGVSLDVTEMEQMITGMFAGIEEEMSEDTGSDLMEPVEQLSKPGRKRSVSEINPKTNKKRYQTLRTTVAVESTGSMEMDDGIADLEKLLRQDPVPFSETEKMEES